MKQVIILVDKEGRLPRLADLQETGFPVFAIAPGAVKREGFISIQAPDEWLPSEDPAISVTRFSCLSEKLSWFKLQIEGFAAIRELAIEADAYWMVSGNCLAAPARWRAMLEEHEDNTDDISTTCLKTRPEARRHGFWHTAPQWAQYSHSCSFFRISRKGVDAIMSSAEEMRNVCCEMSYANVVYRAGGTLGRINLETTHFNRQTVCGQASCVIPDTKLINYPVPGEASGAKWDPGRPYFGGRNKLVQVSSRSRGECAHMIYDTTNLGDDIQSVAAEELVPNISDRVLRSGLASSSVAGKILLAGWFTARDAEWPPSPSLKPTFIGFHANDDRIVTEHVEYLKAHEPIGCRDTCTRDLCLRHGIDAWWSGCVTLTLKRTSVKSKDPQPLTVDYQVRGVENLTQGIEEDAHDRMNRARFRLDRLAAAKCVVTNRLHVALPCAAFGVPVMLIHPPDKRFTGLSDFFHYRETGDAEEIQEFIANPPPNPNAYLLHQMADDLREVIDNFMFTPPEWWSELTVGGASVAPEKVGGAWSPTTPSRRGVELEAVPEFWNTRGIDAYSPTGNIIEVPERGVLDLQGGIVATRALSVVTTDNRVVRDLSWWAGDRKYRMPPFAYSTPVWLEGKTLMVGSDWSYCNFGHWMMDALGRLSTLEQAGRSLDEFDHIMMNVWDGEDSARLIQGLGIPEQKICPIPGTNNAIQCEFLTVPSFDGVSCDYNPTLPLFFQNAINARQWWRSNGDRIYVRRGNKSGRVMANEGEMERIAISHGFRVVDPWSGDVLPDFAGAKVVVGIHQAGLAGLMVCQPGTYFMEIVPTGHQQGYYRNIAAIAGLNLSVMMARSRAPSWTPKFGRYSQAPVDVDLLDFEHALCCLITQP